MNRKTGYAEKAYDKWNAAADRLFGKRSAKQRGLYAASLAVSALISVVFGYFPYPARISGGGYWLTDAFLAVSGEAFPGALAGAVYGSLIAGKLSSFRILGLLTVLLARIAAGLPGHRARLFREPPLMKLGTAALTSLVGAAAVFASDGKDADLLGAVLPALIFPMFFSVLFIPFFGGCPLKTVGKSNWGSRAVYMISALILFFLICYSSAGIKYAGCSLGMLFAIFLTMICADRGGAAIGGVTGALLSLAVRPEYAVPLAVFGVIYGFFSVMGAIQGAGISAFLSSVIAVMIVGLRALNEFVPDMAIAVAVGTPVLRYSFLPPRFPFPKRGDPDEFEALSAAESRAMEIIDRREKLFRLAGAFRELSETLGSVESADPQKNYAETERALLRVRTSVCSTCPLEPICWISEENRTHDSFRKMILYPDSDPKGDYVYSHCIRFTDVKKECKKQSESRVAFSRDSRSRRFGEEYGAVSDILFDIASSSEKENVQDKDAENAAYRAAFALGFRPDLITVTGEREKKITAYGIPKEKAVASGEKLRAAFSAACGVELSQPYYSKEGGETLIFRQAERFACDAFCAKSPKDGEDVSGDSALSFSVPDGKFYCIITDGMGSGREASEASAIASEVLEKLMRCGAGKPVSVRLTGDILLKRGNEVFSTVDLTEIDLLTGTASFVKSGAASSYIVRNTAVYRIGAENFPVGITTEISPEEAVFRLSDGDRVIMMSDGVFPETDDRSSPDAAGIISSVAAQDIPDGQAFAEAIMNKAVSLYGRTDDMTVTVIEITEKTHPKTEIA